MAGRKKGNNGSQQGAKKEEGSKNETEKTFCPDIFNDEKKC